MGICLAYLVIEADSVDTVPGEEIELGVSPLSDKSKGSFHYVENLLRNFFQMKYCQYAATFLFGLKLLTSYRAPINEYLSLPNFRKVTGALFPLTFQFLLLCKANGSIRLENWLRHDAGPSIALVLALKP